MEWHWWGVDFCPRQSWSGHRKQQFISWWPEVCFDLPWKFSRQIVYRSPRIHPVQQSYVSDHLHEQSSLGWCPSLCQSGAWKKEGRHEDSRSCSGKIRNFSTYLIRSQKTKQNCNWFLWYSPMKSEEICKIGSIVPLGKSWMSVTNLVLKHHRDGGIQIKAWLKRESCLYTAYLCFVPPQHYYTTVFF